MMSFTVVPLSCVDCEFSSSMRWICVFFSTLHEPKQSWKVWKWKFPQKLLMMALEPEISSGVNVTHLKKKFPNVFTLPLENSTHTHTPLRALYQLFFTYPSPYYQTHQKIKSEGPNCLSRATDAKENLNYWLTHY